MGITERQYPVFKDFRRRFLEQAKKEFEIKLESGAFKSDLTFDLETIRTGRKITRLKFIIKKQAYQEELPMTFKVEQPAQIGRMIYFGTGEKQALELYQKHGAERIENALDLYGERVEAGIVKKQGGGYLKVLIEEGAGGKSEHEKQLEIRKERKALESNKQAEAKEKAEQKEQERSKQERAALYAKFETLSKKEQRKIMKEFEEQLEGFQIKSYKKSGLDSPMTKAIFSHFLRKTFSKNDKTQKQ